MSFSDQRRRNRGAYDSPFSGVGEEFFPLGVLPDHGGLVLHESGYEPRNSRWDFPHVLSPFWRLYYDLAPGHEVRFPGGTIRLGPDRLVLIPDHQIFDCVGRRPVPKFWLAFSCAQRLTPRQPLPLVLRPRAAERELLRLLCGLFDPRGACADRRRLFHYSLALLHLVLPRPELRWQEGHPAALDEVVRHIETRYAEALRVPELARLARLSPDAFTRLFNRVRGVTPARFVMQVRVREAAGLLAHSTATIDAIAERTGFPDRAYFSRVFKQITGETPAHFRRAHAARPA